MSRPDVQTTKVYVGNLPPDARKEELERAFERYGKLHDVWVARNPPGFAFVEFFDSRDAKDAVRDLDGARLCGASVRVEISHGRGKSGSRGRGGGRPSRDRYGGRDGYDRDRGGRYDDYDDRYSRRSPPSEKVGSRSPPRRGRSPGPPRGWRRSRSRSPGGRY